MRRRIATRFLFIVAVTLAVFAPVAAADARHRSAAQLQVIKGLVARASAQSLTVRTSTLGDRDIQLTSTTEVTAGGRRISPSIIRLGDSLEARVRKDKRGALTAATVKIKDGEAKEFEGVVGAISPTSITIVTSKDSVTVAINADTRVIIHEHPGSLSVVTVGTHVEVDALRASDGTYTALVVKVESETVEVEGVITAISTTSMTIRKGDGKEVVVKLTDKTLARRDDHVVAISSLVVGMRVEVEAVRNADQTLTALLIEVHSEDEFIKIKGVVTAVGTDALTVHTRSGDVTVAVTPDTIIRNDDHVVPLSSIHVGDFVEIDAQQNGGTLTAIRIELDEEDHLLEIEGKITAISGSSITIQTEDGSKVEVNVGATTTIRGEDGPIPLSQLKVGDKIEVKAQRNADGSLQAIDIKVEGEENDDEEDASVEVKGVVTDISSTSLTVKTEGGQMVTVTITPTTVIKKDDEPATFVDIKVGQKVEIKAMRQTDGSLVATRIKIEEEDGEGDD